MKGLILTYLITGLGSIAALRYPLIGLQVYVGLAVLRPQFIFGFAGDLSDLSLVVGSATLIGWALRGFGSWRLGRARPVIVFFLSYVLWFLVSASQALEPAVSVPFILELFKLALPFFVGVTLMEGQDDWRRMLWVIVLAQGYVGLEQNINYLVKGYNSAALGFGGMDNNCFAASLVTVLGPALALMISSTRWYSRVLACAAAAFILHTTFLTFSRGAMIGLIALAVTAFVIMPKRPTYIAALLLTGLIAARFVGPELLNRYKSAFAAPDERDASSESRLELWMSCLEVIELYPVLGVGPANWKIIASRYGWPEGKSAHSIWMETGAELGVPGALFLMLFFLSAAVRLWPMAKARPTEENQYQVILASGVILSIVAFSVTGQFVSVPALEVPYYIVMLGVVMLKTSAGEAVAVEPAPAFDAQLQRLPPVRPLP